MARGNSAHQEPLPPLVKPAVAALASLLVPGLGQVLDRMVQRGLLLLGSMAGILLMRTRRRPGSGSTPLLPLRLPHSFPN